MGREERGAEAAGRQDGAAAVALAPAEVNEGGGAPAAASTLQLLSQSTRPAILVGRAGHRARHYSGQKPQVWNQNTTSGSEAGNQELSYMDQRKIHRAKFKSKASQGQKSRNESAGRI